MNTRQALLERAKAAFAERGYAATSLEGLAHSLGLSKAAVYHHFPSKRALLDALLEEALEETHRALSQPVGLEQRLLGYALAYRGQVEPLMVLKRSGRKETFNPEKLLRGLLLACEKRPVDTEALQRFAYNFEDNVDAAEITSEEIGLKALAFLRDQDPVAYIRFASVYREFNSVENFIDEIRRLERRKGKAQGAKHQTPKA